MAGNGQKSWKWLRLAGNGYKWLDMTGNCLKRMEWLKITENSWNVRNCWKWLETAIKGMLVNGNGLNG